jgi:hypothetical protein
MRNLEFNFNRDAYLNTVARCQERTHGDSNTIILAVIDRKTRTLIARYGQFKNQKVQLATVRPIVSAGWDAMKGRPFLSSMSLLRPALAANEWMGVRWVEDILRRTKACFNGEDIPYEVKRFLLTGNDLSANFANAQVYEWLSQLYGAVSLSAGDAAEREAARLKAIAATLVRSPNSTSRSCPAEVPAWAM